MPRILDRFVKRSLNKFASEDVLKDIEAFFADKNNNGYDKGLAVVKDSIKGNAGFVTRDEKIVKEWLDNYAA